MVNVTEIRSILNVFNYGIWIYEKGIDALDTFVKREDIRFGTC